MNDWDCRKNPVYVTRDAGYKKAQFLSSENRENAKKRVLNPNIVTGKHKLKELFAKRGIVLNPDEMTYL